MDHKSTSKKGFSKFLTSGRVVGLISILLVTIFLVPVEEYLTRQYLKLQLESDRISVERDFKPLLFSFVHNINTGETLSADLAGMIASNLIQGEQINPGDMDRFTGPASSRAVGTLGVVIAPDHIIQYSSPALGSLFPSGVDWYSFDPAISQSAKLSYQTGKPTVSQPFEITPGWWVIASHAPVIKDAHAWGLVSVIIDPQALSARLGLIEDAFPGYRFALTDPSGKRIAGSTLDESRPLIRISSPDARLGYSLAVQPVQAFGVNALKNFNVLRLIGISMIILIGLMLYGVINQRSNLTTAVNQRTRELTSANRSALLLSQCNEALVRIQNDDEMLEKICQVIVNIGQFPFAWVGILDDRYPGQIIPRACYGNQRALEDLPSISRYEMESYRQASGESDLGSEKPLRIENLEEVEFMSKWKSLPGVFPIRTLLLLPLLDNKTPIGLLAVHSGSPGVFNKTQVSLLSSLANDIAFGLTAMRTRQAKRSTELSLRRERDMFQRLMETSPSGVLVVDATNRITFFNNRAREIFGAPGIPTENLADNFSLWKALDDQNLPVNEEDLPYNQIINSGLPLYNRILQLEVGPHDTRWVLVNGAPLLDADGAVESVILTLEDITINKKSELALGKSEKRYRQLLETVQDGIWILDETLHTTYANQSMAEMLGCSIEEMPGKSILDFMSESQVASFRKDIPRLRQTKAVELDSEFTNRKGKLVITSIHTAPFTDEHHRWKGLMAIVTDITSRRLKERELEAITRMANALRDADTHSDVASIILETMCGLFKGQGSALAVKDAAKKIYTFEYSYGTWSTWKGTSHPSLSEVSRKVFETGRHYISLQAGDDPNLSFPEFISRSQTVLCLPLITHEKTIGVVWLGRDSSESHAVIPPGADEVRLLTAAADIAASSLQRASLMQKTEISLNRLSAQRDINLTISTSLDMKTVLEKLLHLVTDKLQVSAADVLLFDSESGSLKYAAGKDILPPPAVGSGIAIARDYAGKSITANQIVSVTREQNLLDGFSRSWKSSLKEYHHYEAIPLISQGLPKGVLELFYRDPPSADAEWTDFLSSIASQLAITLDNLELFEKLRISNLELTTAYDATIEGWSKAMELRDQETEGHAERVVDITISLAKVVGVSEESLEHVRRGALLHDIGKMAIPDSILFKQGPLTPEETRIMKQHPTFARQLLSPIAYLRPALDIPYCHHEQWDGSGYPQGLKGKEIPLYARIFTIVDVWDALRSDRPYRKSWAEEKVKMHIQRASGQAFDPEIVEVFIKDVLPGITGANSKNPHKKN